MARLTPAKRVNLTSDWHASSLVYTVRGPGRFPLDMLRYDQAVPASETDASYIAATLADPSRDRTLITLRGVKPPTEARWRSFGWQVLPEGFREEAF